MKKIIFSLGIIFLSICYTNVLAANCTTSEMNRLKEIANNIQFKTSYEKVVDDEYKDVEVYYKIDVINSNPDIRIAYRYDYEKVDEFEYNYITDNKLEYIPDGSKLIFSLYAYTENSCTEVLLKTVTVDLPKYNDYYYFNKEKCDANPDFKYCKEFVDSSNYTFEEIDKLFDEYLDKGTSTSQKGKNNGFNLYIIGGSILAVVIVAIVIVIVAKKKKRESDVL